MKATLLPFSFFFLFFASLPVSAADYTRSFNTSHSALYCDPSDAQWCHVETFQAGVQGGGTVTRWARASCSSGDYKGQVTYKSSTSYGFTTLVPDRLHCFTEPPVIPDQPSDCYEQGLAYDSQKQECTEVCENGVLNGVCLNPTPDNDDTCNADSPDYKGYIGNGSTRQNFCSSDMQCDGGSFGLVNGIPACIPDAYSPPVCDAHQVITIDRYGFVCTTPNDSPDVPEPEPDPERDPNTDTDGDGIPDEYRPENDPASLDKSLTETNRSLAEANSELKKVNSKLDRIYGATKEIADQGQRMEEAIASVPGNLDAATSDVGELGDNGLDLTDNIDVNIPDLLGDYTDVNDPVVSECPAPRELSLALGTFQVVWTPWCDFASQIRPFVLFMFSFIGVMAVARTATQ